MQQTKDLFSKVKRQWQESQTLVTFVHFLCMSQYRHETENSVWVLASKRTLLQLTSTPSFVSFKRVWKTWHVRLWWNPEVQKLLVKLCYLGKKQDYQWWVRTSPAAVLKTKPGSEGGGMLAGQTDEEGKKPRGINKEKWENFQQATDSLKREREV